MRFVVLHIFEGESKEGKKIGYSVHDVQRSMSTADSAARPQVVDDRRYSKELKRDGKDAMSPPRRSVDSKELMSVACAVTV